MPQDTAFIDQVLAYAQERPYCIAQEVAELAPGVVTVHDVSNDYDTYFDSARWKAAHPQAFGDTLFLGMEGTEMGTLIGVSSISPIDSFRAALQFAKYHLQSTSSVQMYAQPQLVDLEQRIASLPRQG